MRQWQQFIFQRYAAIATPGCVEFAPVDGTRRESAGVIADATAGTAAFPAYGSLGVRGVRLPPRLAGNEAHIDNHYYADNDERDSTV
jgi:hypothetical protein